jgi:hypothetical protein
MQISRFDVSHGCVDRITFFCQLFGHQPSKTATAPSDDYVFHCLQKYVISISKKIAKSGERMKDANGIAGLRY